MTQLFLPSYDTQLNSFGKSTWSFISAIFKSSWDKLYMSEKRSFQEKIFAQFTQIKPPHSQLANFNNLVKRIPPPIPFHPTKNQLEKSKIHQAGRDHKKSSKNSLIKSFAQAIVLATNILKIKEAFPVLPDKKIIEIHNVALTQLANKVKKVQYTTKELSRKQAIVPLLNKHIKTIINNTNLLGNQANAVKTLDLS